MSAHATRTDGVWRVMRFENSKGEYAEVASNHVGPEAVPLPPGYRFVSSVPMVPATVSEEMVERACDLTWSGKQLTPAHARAVLAAALRQEDSP